MKILNIAVWTVGEHAKCNILPAINKSKSVSLVGVFTRNVEIRFNQSQQYNCYSYNTSNDLLKDSSIDIIYISSPNALHYQQVKQCLLNNKHVIVEKTALVSLKEAREIVELAKSKKLMIMEAFMFLHHRQFHDLRELINSEKYGKMLFIEASFGFPHLDVEDIRYSKELAGGALNDAGAYTICAALNLLDYDVKLEYSSIDTKNSYDVDTSGLAVIEKNGVKAICKWVMGGSYINNITIWCEKGHVIVDRAFSKPEGYKSKIQINHNGEIVEEVLSGEDNHFINMLEYLSSLIHHQQFDKQYKFLINQSKILQEVRL